MKNFIKFYLLFLTAVSLTLFITCLALLATRDNINVWAVYISACFALFVGAMAFKALLFNKLK